MGHCRVLGECFGGAGVLWGGLCGCCQVVLGFVGDWRVLGACGAGGVGMLQHVVGALGC